MSLVRRSAIIALVVIVVISTAPSAAAGINEPDDWSDHIVFDDASDNYSIHGDNESLKKAYINVTSSTVQFRANINAPGVDGLDDNALQIYIDTDLDAQTGLNSGTIEDDEWGNFYDGVGDIGADYRITASDAGVPIVEEHDEGAIFETREEVDIVESGDKVVVEVDKETIGNPENFDVKFAYISNPGTADISESEFGWVPENAVRVGSESGDAAKTATVEPTVTFGEALDDEASVEFTLTNDDGTQTIREVNHSSSGDLTETFTVDPNNFDGGDSSEIAVEVIDDNEYSFEREVANTKSIGSLSASGKANPTIDLATINATVEFGSDAVDEDGSVIFTLTENDDGDTTVREVDHSSSDDLEESFTVNANNFSSSGTLNVEVVGDETYPYSETKSVDSVAQDTSIDRTFNSDTIGQDFTLINKESDPYDIATDSDDEFGLNVTLESDDADGSDIYNVRHVIDFDPARIDEENISVDYSAGPNSPDFKTDDKYLTTGTGTDIEGDGKYEIEIVAAGDYDADGDAILEENKNRSLYHVTFPLEDIQAEIDQGSGNAIDVTPSTADETELFDSNNNSVSYTSSAQAVNVSNSNTAIEEIGYTHRTEGGNMVGAPMKFDVDVTTNDGKLNEIRLENTGGVVLEEDGSDVQINCNDKSNCDGVLKYTPVQSNNTWDAGYGKEKFKIVVEDDDGDLTTIPDDTEDIDNVWATIYKANDVNEDGTPADIDDVRAVINNRGEGDGELPLGEDDDVVARADLDNDGEVGITEVTAIANEYSP